MSSRPARAPLGGRPKRDDGSRRRLVLAALLAFAWVPHAAGQERAVCAAGPDRCTLAEVARAARFFAGAAVASSEQNGVADTLGSHFNSLTPEDALKWGELAASVDVYDFSRADALVDLAGAAGARVRGHTLVWSRGPLPSDLASEVAAAADPAARLTELMEAHIRAVVGRYAGRVESWDVVNEPLQEYGGGALYDDLFSRLLGERYIDRAFAAAHAADPSAHLYLNEFFSDYSDAKAKGFIALVQRLLARGVPLHGVGIQAHQNPQPSLVKPYDPAFATFLSELAALGVEIELTELDMTIWWFRKSPDPLAAQGAAYGRLAADCVAVPACRGITVWGVTDPDTFMDQVFPWNATAPNRPLLFDGAVAAKPAYFALRDAIAARLPPGRDEDRDGDGVPDRSDNCQAVANADQADADGDGYGNVCDPDLNEDGIVNFQDLAILKQVFFSQDLAADLNGDGVVDFADLAIMKKAFFKAPGPAAGKP